MLHTLALGRQAAALSSVYRCAHRIPKSWESPSPGELGLVFPRTPLAILVRRRAERLRSACLRVSTCRPLFHLNSDRCGTRLPRYSLREPCMVCHIAETMWWRDVTPPFLESPPVIEPCLVVPLPGFEPGKSPQSECGAFANLTRGAYVLPQGLPALHVRQPQLGGTGSTRTLRRRRGRSQPPHPPRRGEVLEWKTGLEPATCTLARCRATNCATSTDTHAFRSAAADLLGSAIPPNVPCVDRGVPSLTVPRAARAADWSPTTVEPPPRIELGTSPIPRARSFH